MGRLSSTYRAALRQSPSVDGEDAELEEALATLCARARAKFPTFSIGDDDFVAHLAKCGAEPIADPATGSLHIEDLYLAFACLSGDERAIEQLVAAQGAVLTGKVKRIDPSPSFADEVLQKFWDSSLVGTISNPPRIAKYSGRGPLEAWLGVSVQREALMIRRRERAEDRARRFGHDGDALASDPELALIRESHRAQFQLAARDALASLEDRDRMIFRLHLVDGVTIEQIARGYGVSHSTVSRWFAAARSKVIAAVEAAIRSELQLSPAEFESLKRVVLSDVHLSLSALPP
jgi:RNA polymerase sigma-70 factor (ECF subfamily)